MRNRNHLLPLYIGAVIAGGIGACAVAVLAGRGQSLVGDRPAVFFVFLACLALAELRPMTWLSLTDDSAYTAERSFVGLGNYVELLGDSTVRSALIFTVVFAAASTLLELVRGFALALLLNATFRLRGAARAVALIPWAIPAVVSALGFRFIFSDGFGIVPHLLGVVGVQVDWLTDPFFAKVAVILANVPRVEEPNASLLKEFIAGGGGLIVAAGDRVDAKAYDQTFYNGGLGWLPAKLESAMDLSPEAPGGLRVSDSSLELPWVARFRREHGGEFALARFTKWWIEELR